MMADSSYLQETKEEDSYSTFVPPPDDVSIHSYDNQLDAISSGLIEAGAVVIKNVFTEDVIESFKKTLQPIKQLHCLDKKGVSHGEYHCITFEEGRQDIWDLSNEIHIDIPIMKSLMDEVMGCQWIRSSLGALPLESKNWGRWHRDVVPLFEDIQHTLCLPDFYYIVFIPLDDLTVDNGATQIILNSHNGEVGYVSSRALCNKGDIIVMNGKCLHRSTPNLTEDCRDMLYIIYCAVWYNESKF